MTWLGLAVGAYALLLGAAYLGQRFVLYPAPPFPLTPSATEAKVEHIDVPGVGSTLALHFVAPADATTVVHFHGNGEQLANLVPLGRALRRAGLGFFAVEYPGYGLVGGKPSEPANYAAADAALAFLKESVGVTDDKIVLQGQSLGSGIAVEMATRGHGSRLILISPFTNTVEIGKRLLPILPVGLLLGDRYDNAEKAPRVRAPVLIVHGTADGVVPFVMGKRLAELLPDAEFIAIPGAGHNDLFSKFGDRVLPAITKFGNSGSGG